MELPVTCVDVWDRIVPGKGNPHSNHGEMSWLESVWAYIDPLLVHSMAILLHLLSWWPL